MAETTPFRNASGQSYVQNYDFTPHAYTRTLPVAPWVQEAISNAVYSADPSLQIRVSSGGQTPNRDPSLRNAANGWTGSTRHDNGGAADFSLVRNGEKLPIQGNENLYQSVARNLAAQGVPGIGVDMGEGYIHAGGGSEAAWGYQGNSSSSRFLPSAFASAINEGRSQYRNNGGIPMPPGEIPNVVASRVDVTPQARSVPRPQPRPQKRPEIVAAITPKMIPEGVNYPFLPPMTNTSVTRGLGSLTPFAVQETRPSTLPQSAMLPNSMPVNVPLPRPRPLSARDIANVPMDRWQNIPTRTPRLPMVTPTAVQTAAATGFRLPSAFPPRPQTYVERNPPRPISGFPTPLGQRPALTAMIPPPLSQRPPSVPQPLRVVVNGAGSYNAPAPQPAFIGSSTGRSYAPGQRYSMGGQTFTATPGGGFVNERTGREVAQGTGWQALHGLS